MYDDFTASLSRVVTVIDDFTNDTLSSEWVKSDLINNLTASTAVVHFDTTTNPDKLTYSFSDATNTTALQAVLLRDDYSLVNDTDYVQVTSMLDYVSGSSTSTLSGLVLHSGSKAPANRNNIYLLQTVGDGSIRAQSGITQLRSSGAGTYQPGNEVILRITRNSATTVPPSYSLDGGSTFIDLGGPDTIAGFKALGFYAGNNQSNQNYTFVYDDLVMLVHPPCHDPFADFDNDGDVGQPGR